MTHGLICWTVTVCFMCITQGLKPEQTVRRGPGSDPQCMSPLIGSLDEFPDSAFSASSVLQNKTGFQPFQARLIDVYGSREHTSGYAWCPDSFVGEMLRDWIQADFAELVMIKSIFTAGRGDGNVREFMPSFVLRYQREDDGAWYEHVKRDGTRVLKANSDPRNLARATLDSIVIAKRIRIYPYSRQGSQKVCLRFALYGCKFPDGVVSYSVLQGGWSSRDSLYQPVLTDAIDSNIVPQLKDLSYDGQLIGTSDQLSDGLGQLMDNVAFLGNLTRESDLHPSQPGFHFVGWHPKDRTDVQIVFKFDRARQFTWLRLFSFDSIPLRVRLFAHATVSFSLDGVQYGNTVEFSTGRVQYFDSHTASLPRSADDPPTLSRSKRRAQQPGSGPIDLRMYTHVDYDGAVVVELPLGERTGRYIRLSLTPTDNWIVLSEVQFNSTIAQNIPISPVAVQGRKQTVIPNENVVAPNPPHSESPLHPVLPGVGGLPETESRSFSVVEADRFPSENADGTTVSAAKQSLTDRERLVAVLPVIVTTSVLLLLLPAVLLIWFCSRRHTKRSRCRRKLPFVDGTRGLSHHPPVVVDNFAPGTNGLTADEMAKLLGAYSTMPFKPDGAAHLCLSNGTHRATACSGMVPSNFQPAQYMPVHHSCLQAPPQSTGTAMACSPQPNSSGSSSDAVPALTRTGTGTVAQSSGAPGNFNNIPEASNVYQGADTNGMSPEYASASIFGYSPPPSETPSNPPPTCLESMPPVDYRPNLPDYTVSLSQAAHAPNAALIYTGPSSLPLSGTALKVHSRHTTPNPVHRRPSGAGSRNSGLLFFPQSPFTSLRFEDQNGFYPTVSPKNMEMISDQIPPNFGLYQTNLLTSAGAHVLGEIHGPQNALESWFLHAPVATNMNPHQAVWLPDPSTSLAAPAVHQLNNGPSPSTTLHLPVSTAIDPKPGGLHTSPQHVGAPRVVFTPGVHSIPQYNNPAESTMVYNRGSPVGAALGSGATNCPSEGAGHEGTNSARLSVYSVCT